MSIQRTPWEVIAGLSYSRLVPLLTHAREQRLKKPPLRIRHEDCIVCDSCQRSCPAHFGAIINTGLDVRIVPELCTGCGICLSACPISCIHEDESWSPSDEQTWSMLNPSNDPYVSSRDVAALVPGPSGER